MTENDKDIELLRTDPRALLLKYQEMIKIIVKKFIRDGLFKSPQFDDIVQDVNLALLGKIQAMQAQYNGISLFRTYLSVIVRNICLKEYRTIDRNSVFEQDEDLAAVDSMGMEDGFALKNEIQRFKTILKLFERHLPKLLLCMKLHYRIPLSSMDIQSWYPHCSSSDVAVMMMHFSREYDSINDSEMYQIITPIMNRNEGKENSTDAVRKWTDSKIHEIIRLLNARPHKTVHDEETIRILFDDYFSPFLYQK